MTLRKILDGIERPRGGTSCRTCSILNELQGDDRAVLNEWLCDSSKSAAMIRKGLGQFGYQISVSALNRHRRDCPPLQ